MRRLAEDHLKEWITKSRRKPLVLRGARQVGKTWLVRHFARSQGLELIELNFESKIQIKAIFTSNDPCEYLRLLEQQIGERIDINNSLLFLDEIQAFPEMLAKLRWIYEELPELAVIATGSLLDFVLADHTFSMPVGRISYYYLEPLSFTEFLFATGNDMLVDAIKSVGLNDIKKRTPIHSVTHEKLINLFKTYCIVGGMPEALVTWVETESYLAVSEVQQNLLMTYRDDFSKYSGRSNKDVLDAVFTSIPKNLGSVTKYSNLDRGSRTEVAKKALQLLVIARVCHKVSSVSAEGVPLGATVSSKKFKTLFIDVGLATAALGFIMDANVRDQDLVMINNGSIAEQAVGQLLRAGIPYYMEKELYYWSRDKKGSEAEVDYVTSYGQTIIPIEVKAGKTGSMKSLHSLMFSKNLNFAIRVNSDLPSWVHVEHGLRDGIKSNYDLLSLPCYMTEQIPRLLADEINQLK